ncbi:rho guanine nucleotide exchange factor 40 [Hyperolius riggenbachi]|uniref:rho guanine nucleotide exchange factor 40 n=1 Tax=Hyperolius riggenbachi TaxID=752182 RepID=UPI0035A37B5A
MTPQSVEDCLQSTLSSLYPPFEATAPTLLTQVFSVLERTYREDPLRYTLEFLIPAKRILQNVQHQACSQYSGFLFFHEGWPLCLGEKILIQLSSLPWHFLKNGDFYLQVVPYLECSPRLVLKCLSQDGSGVQEIVVPESSHSFIFSAEWLNSINKDRSTVRLENCLAAVEEKVLRLPWSEVIYPRFIHKEGFIVGRRCPPVPLMPPLEYRSPGDGGIAIGDLVDPKIGAHLSLSNDQDAIGSWREGAISPVLGSFSCSLTDSVEGEYVELSPPHTDLVGKIECPIDSWASRAKTAPSRKGKKKGNQSWLHQRKPGKVGSLSTLKGRSQELKEDIFCAGDAEDQAKDATDSPNYWDVETTSYSTESNALAEWRKGLDLLQRQERDIISERQVWGCSESQLWKAKDCSEENTVSSWSAEKSTSRHSSQEEDSILQTLQECSLQVDSLKERENLLSVAGTGDVAECQRIPSVDSLPLPTEKQGEIVTDIISTSVGSCESESPKESKQSLDTLEEVCNSRESSLTRKGRTWADGQETSEIQDETDDVAEDAEMPSIEIKQHTEKGKHPVWNPVTELSHKGGRGKRKKRNKRGRGPIRIEVRKAAHKVGQEKLDSKKEEPELETTSKESVTSAVTTEEEPASLVNQEPEQSPQSFLLRPIIISDYKCLHRDINWGILESGVLCLTGGQTQDKRALLIASPAKASSGLDQKDLQDTVIYFFSLLRPDVRGLGMTLILDLQDGTDNMEVFLQMLQNKDAIHGCINHTLLVCDAENPAAVQSDLQEVQTVPASDLTQFVESEELPESLGGAMPFVLADCVRSLRSLSNLHTLCCDVLESLEKVTQEVKADITEDIQQLITHHREAMKNTLTDERLQRLQRDGGTLVARLQKSPYLRLYDSVTFELYERVDEALHKLVQLSNQKLQDLEARLPLPDCRDRIGETRMPDEYRVPFLEPEGRRLEVGVRIRGLEVSSRELADRTCSPPRGHVLSRTDGRGPNAPWGGIPKPDGRRSPQRLLLDLLCSERSYVQSLRRSLEVRGSCPAGLALRGSLEQLLNFHTHFLRDLQNCVPHPFTVSYCFLQHADQLRLYSLYVKNRQKVELFLPSPSGSLKGKKRDQKEEDESWTVLHRPLEQLDQYQRFLAEMMQECDQDSEQERQSLHAARELVGSLVHHGKNLLAAEAIRGFEVDEKEHGRLLLKDVFTVLSGRKKSVRHVFLFQKLLLLSKLKTAEGGLESYGFKQVFKTADMGITENATEGDTRIELWFRRQKSKETLLLQAETTNVKESWTNEITKLLWDQGGLCRDQRGQDTSTIGSSHRSFLDIKAGLNAIGERTVSALLTARGSRTRLSVPLISCDHSSHSPPSSLALASGPSPRRLRSPGGVSLPDKISEEGGDAFTGGPVCLKSISPIVEGEKPKDLAIEVFFPSTSV